HARLDEHIAVEARQRADARTVTEHAVAGDPLVEHADSRVRRGEALRQLIRQRLFVFGVDLVPSVIESPKVTMAPTRSGATTSTRARKNQACVVVATGRSASPA